MVCSQYKMYKKKKNVCVYTQDQFPWNNLNNAPKRLGENQAKTIIQAQNYFLFLSENPPHKNSTFIRLDKKAFPTPHFLLSLPKVQYWWYRRYNSEYSNACTSTHPRLNLQLVKAPHDLCLVCLYKLSRFKTKLNCTIFGNTMARLTAAEATEFIANYDNDESETTNDFEEESTMLKQQKLKVRNSLWKRPGSGCDITAAKWGWSYVQWDWFFVASQREELVRGKKQKRKSLAVHTNLWPLYESKSIGSNISPFHMWPTLKNSELRMTQTE